MRTIERTGQFKRDYKRESKGQHRKGLDEALVAVLELLLADKPLPAKYRDHPLAGIGLIIAIATSSLTCCLSTACQMHVRFSWFGLVRIASWACSPR